MYKFILIENKICKHIFLQSIPEDMQFCPNVNPACYKSKEEVCDKFSYNKKFTIINFLIIISNICFLGCRYPGR